MKEEVKKCVDAYKTQKINLTRDSGGTNGEGVWVTPCSAEDLSISNMTIPNTMFEAYLCNKPLTWDKVWGDKIIIRCNTNSKYRHYARLEDNKAIVCPMSKDRLSKIFKNSTTPT